MRWIETQETILSRTKSERIIEIGPNATLLGMFRKTIDTIHPTRECTLRAPRQLLHSEKDTDEIYYTRGPDQLGPAQTQTQKPVPTPGAALPTPTRTVDVPAARLSPLAHAKAASIEDHCIQAQDIVFAIVSRALKRSVAEVDGNMSIKALTEGT